MTSFMPEELGSVFNTLWKHTARAYAELGEFEALFGHSTERFEFLQATARVFFFQAVYGPLWGSVLLNITQLTARPKASERGRTNMTVQALPPLVDAAIRDQLTDAVNASVVATAFALPARNRWIAHLDHATALDPANSGITLGSSTQVREALASIRDVLNVVSGHYSGTTNDFELGVTPGAETLVAMLRLARKA